MGLVIATIIIAAVYVGSHAAMHAEDKPAKGHNISILPHKLDSQTIHPYVTSSFHKIYNPNISYA